MKTGQVYILKCNDDSYYTGVSKNPEKRLAQHNSGIPGSYTFYRRPVEMVWCSEEMKISTAIENEKRIKGWRRAKKEALINGNFQKLHQLSKAYYKKDQKE